MGFSNRDNKSPEVVPRSLSLYKQGPADEVFDLDTQLACHYLQMASTIIPNTLSGVLVTMENLGDIPRLEDIWRQQAHEIGRFYERLKRQFDDTVEVVSEMKDSPNKLRLLALRQRVKDMVSHIVLLSTWAEELGTTLVTGLERSSNTSIVGHYEGYDEELEEESPLADDSQSLGDRVRTTLEEVAADMRAQMAILSQADGDQVQSTVADLLAGFSSAVVYIEAPESSDVITSHKDAASIAIDLVLNTMVRGHQDVTTLPEVTPEELVLVSRGQAAALASYPRLEQVNELLMTVVPLKVSPMRGGKVRMSFALPEGALSLWQPHVARLVEQLQDLSPLIGALGGQLSQGSKLVGGNVEVLCELQLPGQFDTSAPISADTSVVTTRDREVLENLYSLNYSRMLDISVRSGNEEPAMSIQVPSAAFCREEGRTCISRILPYAVQLSREFGGRTITLVPGEDSSSVIEAFATSRFRIVIQGDPAPESRPNEGSGLSSDFQAGHRLLRRWKKLQAAAREFSEAPQYITPYISLPVEALESPKVLTEVRAIGQLANLVCLYLPTLDFGEKKLLNLVLRVRKAVESALEDTTRNELLNVAISLVKLSSAEPPMIQFVCADTAHVPHAMGRIGIVDRSEERHTFPAEQIGYLVSSIREVLTDLWPARRLTLEAFQRELSVRGCALASSFVITFVETQLRREELLSLYELNGILFDDLVSQRDAFVIRSDFKEYRISLLSRIEDEYLYGTDR